MSSSAALALVLTALLLAACGPEASLELGGPVSPRVTPAEQRPAGPPPRAGRVAPPPAWLSSERGAHWMQFGSYCWTAARTGVCADFASPLDRPDLPTVRLRRGETIGLHLGFTPKSLTLRTLPGRRVIRLPARRHVTWKVAGRPRALTLFARPAEGGDASYAIAVRVTPPRSGSRAPGG